MRRARAGASATVPVYAVSAPVTEQSPVLGMKVLDQIVCLCPVLLPIENLWFPRGGVIMSHSGGHRLGLQQLLGVLSTKVKVNKPVLYTLYLSPPVGGGVYSGSL